MVHKFQADVSCIMGSRSISVTLSCECYRQELDTATKEGRKLAADLDEFLCLIGITNKITLVFNCRTSKPDE